MGDKNTTANRDHIEPIFNAEDVAEDHSSVEQFEALPEVKDKDEPQFSLDTNSKKSMLPIIGIAVVAFSIVGGLIYFIVTGGLFKLINKIPSVNPDSTQEFVVESAGETVGIPENLPAIPTQNVAIEPELDNDRDVPSGSAGSNNLSVVLAELVTIKESISLLSRDISQLKGKQALMERNSNNRAIGFSNKIDDFNSQVVGISKDVKKNGQWLNDVLSGVDGFRSDSEKERTAFTFKVLHYELYGGKKRLIGFEVNHPLTAVKVYEGEKIGYWRLVKIQGNKAHFQHDNGIQHIELIE